MANIISITAEGEDFIVRDPLTETTSRMSWPELSNIAPGLKYRCECIAALFRSVGATEERGFNITGAADELIEKATEAARLLY